MTVEAGYFVLPVDDARGMGFATGPEPAGEWADELLGDAEDRLSDWDA